MRKKPSGFLWNGLGSHFILSARIPLAIIGLVLILWWVSCENNIALADRKQTKDSNDANQPAADANQPKQAPPKSDTADKDTRPTHKHIAFSQRQDERTKMVAGQIRDRGVADPNVLVSLQTVPRHAFVRPRDLHRAYRDHPLPIGFNQTISQPYIVAYMTEVLDLKGRSKVLEIGTGSGYQAAVCAEIAGEVYTIEIIEALAESARKRLRELGYPNVFVKAGDGYFGWSEKAPFDVIIVTCAAGFVPPPLLEQLKAGGRMVLPLGSPYGSQTLVLVTKAPQTRKNAFGDPGDDKELPNAGRPMGNISSKQLLPVRFVPMLGRIGKGQR